MQAQSQPYEMEFEPETEIDLRQYWHAFKRRIWIFISVFLVVVTLASLHSLRQTPVYRATATLIIEQEIPNYYNRSFDMTGRGYLKDYYGTQYEIIKSRKVARKAVELLELSEEEEAVEEIRGRISVAPIRDSGLVKVSIDHEDPHIARKQADAVSRAYITHNMEDKRSASRDTFSWLTEQLAVLKASVSKSEMELLKFKEKEDIVSLEKRQSLLEEKLSDINSRYSGAIAKSMELETLLNEMQKIVQTPEMAESLPRIVQNTLIQNLKSEYSRLEGELAKDGGKLKPKHPRIVSLRSQIRSVRDRLASEVNKIIKSIEIEYRISKTNEKAIKTNLDELKRESMRLAQQAIQYGVLKREAESNKQMYEVMLQRLKETDISGSITANNIRIVDEAKIPETPIRPRTRRDILLAVVLGTALGLGLCFLLEYLDNTLRNEEDVQVYLKERLTGLILWDKKLKPGEFENSELLIRSYGAVKTVLNFYRNEHVLKSMVVTGTVRGEGKSLTTLMLGKSFAQSGVEVLIIDADLFRPQIARRLGLKGRAGLSDYFLNNAEPESLIMDSGIPHLSVIPSGLLPRNPTELLESGKMKTLVERLKDRFDIIIFDTPPLTAAFEVSVLCSYVDGVLFAVRAGFTPRNLVKNTLARMEMLRVNILGILLTCTQQEYRESYYYYYKYYKDDYNSDRKRLKVPPPPETMEEADFD